MPLLLLVGAGIGWLVGLSASAVAQTLLAGILATVAGVVTALSRSDKPAENGPAATLNTTPVPLALLIVGVVIGSTVGIFARANDLLGVQPRLVARRWEGSGILREDVIKRLFDRQYASSERPIAPPSVGALFAVANEECVRLRNTQPDNLRTEVQSSSSPRLARIADRIKDPTVLGIIVEEACRQ